MGRLQPLTLEDFTGGLNIRENSFQLADNETPQMMNVHVDRRGGFVTRTGWGRWNNENIGDPADWGPRHSTLHQYSDGTFAVYVASNNTIWRGDIAGQFDDTGIECYALPHLADFAEWGNEVYIATGGTSSTKGIPTKHDQAAVVPLLPAGQGRWNNDYTIPTTGVMPQADLVEAHGGYLFCAGLNEDYDGDGVQEYPWRLRWSHPSEPESWAQLDYLDIQKGGSRITAIKSFGDHLLIFKESRVWALYGYDNESWQLVEVANNSGCSSPAALTSSADDCYYYSNAGRSGVYAFSGGQRPQRISENIRLVTSEVRNPHNIWLDWVSDRLFCSLPWIPQVDLDGSGSSRSGMDRSTEPMGAPTDTGTTTFLFDLTIKEGGAWEAVRPARGSLAGVLEMPGDKSPVAVHWGTPENSCLLRLGTTNDAVDQIDQLPAPRTPFRAYYTTNWKNAGTEELRKHWLRPRFVVRNPDEAVTIRVAGFRNYDNTSPYRTWTMGVDSFGRAYWRDEGASAPQGDGFDWDDGTLWAGLSSGSRIIRGGPLGIARSIRLFFSVTPASEGRAWGIDAVTLKYIERRFTT